MSSRLNCLATVSLSVLLLSGCSSDSGGDGPSNLNGVPRPITDDSTNPAPPGPETAPVPETAPGPETAPAPESAPVPETAPIPETTPEAPSTPRAADVNNLIGNVRFEFTFSDSSDVFTLEKTFSANGGGIDPNTGMPFIQSGLGTTIVTRCIILPNALPYFCAEASAASATTVSFRLFLFNLDSSRTGTGTFEFCPAEIAVDVCVLDALTTPDGRVSVSVNTGNAVTLVPLNIRQQRITTDAAAHQLVAEQAQPAWNPTNSISLSSTELEQANDWLEPLLSSVTQSSLDGL